MDTEDYTQADEDADPELQDTEERAILKQERTDHSGYMMHRLDTRGNGF